MKRFLHHALYTKGAILAFVFIIGLSTFGMSTPAQADGASVIMYHRFGENDFPTTNIRIEQFEAHIRELVNGDYNVLPLPEIIESLRNGRTLPNKTVGISIDDAYLSVYTEAWPRLRAANLPFTLFVATDSVDRNFSRYMSWDQIRDLHKDGVTIGSQTASHLHMVDASSERNLAELDKSGERFEKELGERPQLFAYPYGEFSLATEQLVEEYGFRAAFGQHSGAFDASGFYRLPRFAMNENFGDIDRFRTAVRTLPLPISEMTPLDSKVVAANNPPPLGFTIEEGINGLGALACYSANEGKLQLDRLGDTRIEVRFSSALPHGRTRINCTMPGPNQRWYWLGRMLYVPNGE